MVARGSYLSLRRELKRNYNPRVSARRCPLQLPRALSSVLKHLSADSKLQTISHGRPSPSVWRVPQQLWPFKRRTGRQPTHHQAHPDPAADWGAPGWRAIIARTEVNDRVRHVEKRWSHPRDVGTTCPAVTKHPKLTPSSLHCWSASKRSPLCFSGVSFLPCANLCANAQQPPLLYPPHPARVISYSHKSFCCCPNWSGFGPIDAHLHVGRGRREKIKIMQGCAPG